VGLCPVLFVASISGHASMTFRFPRFSLLAAAAVILATAGTSLTAQEGEGAQGRPSPGQLRKARQEMSDKQAGEEKNAKWANMTPEERLNASIRRDARGQCRFVAACRPPKLMPGQSGTLLITAILQGAAVLPAPLQMTMTPRSAPESVAVGDMMARPAQPGVMAKGYLGRPVYENTAILEVPITMGNEAKLGSKQPVALDLKFDIYDGSTAQIVGRFVERVSANVEVGQYIDPVVAGRKAKPTIEVSEPAIKVDDPVAPPEAKTDRDPIEVTNTAGNVPQPDNNVVDDGPEEAVGSGELPSTEEDGMPIALIAGGGAFLLIIVLLMMRKKQ